MNYYIKSNFGKLKEVNGEELKQGYNAFTSIESLLDKYTLDYLEDSIIFLDSKTVIKYKDIKTLINSSKDVNYNEDESYKPTGSLEITNSRISWATNFKDVTINNSSVYCIRGSELLKENVNGTGKWTEEIKSVGKAQVKDSSIDYLEGFSNVNVENSNVNMIMALNKNYYTVAGYQKDEEINNLKTKYDSTSVSGTITTSLNEKATGSVTIKNSQVDYINGYSNITITDTGVSYYIASGGKYTDKETYTFKTNKDGKVTIDYTYNGSGTASNTLKVMNSYIGSVDGFSTVTLLNSSSGSIESNGVYKGVYKDQNLFDSVDDALYFYENRSYGEKIKLESEDIGQGSGSVTVKLDKNAIDNINVGGIKYFNKVNVSGYGDLEVYIEGNIKTLYEKNKDKSDSINASDYRYREFKATGSVTLSNNVTVDGSIANYEKVSITNGYVNGSIIAYEVNDDFFDPIKEIDYDFFRSGYAKLEATKNADGSYKFIGEAKATGTVTLKDAFVKGNVEGFAKVTLTNSEVHGGIFGGTNGTYTESYSEKTGEEKFDKVIKSSNTLIATNSFISEISNFGTVKLTNCNVYDSIYGVSIPSNDYEEYNTPTGNFTFAIDSKTATEEMYTIGGIERFSNVKISGFADFKKGKFVTAKVEGNISGNGSLEIKNDVWVNGGLFGFNKVTITTAQIDEGIYVEPWNDDEVCAIGSATINDATIIGDISGYKTVKITDANIGGIDGLNTQGTTATLSNVDITSGIFGVQKVTFTKGCELGSFTGTDYDDTFTINKGSCVELSSSLYFGKGNDKLVLNGTLVLNESIDFNEIELESISGNGVIAGSSEVIENSDFFDDPKSKIVYANLGYTSEDFKGKDVELADNTEKKAAVADWDWESEYNCYVLDGWLGKDVDIEDTCDWLKFTAEFDGTVTFNDLGSMDELKVNGTVVDSFTFDVTKGTSYKICVTRNEEDSTCYVATMVER